MAVLQRVVLLPNERLDTPDARAIEAFALNDFRFFMSGFMSDRSYVLTGFDVSNYATIFTVAGFKVKLSNIVLFHSEATTQASGFYVFAGTEPDAVVSLAPSSTNFIECDLTTVSGVPDVRAFWDQAANAGAGGEFTDTIDTVINLDAVVTSNISGFTVGKIPLYKAVTDGSGVVTSLPDCRQLFFRLGSGGNTPNAAADYDWPSLPDVAHERLENALTTFSATATNQPFLGGDKNITNFKSWMDAVMTSIKEIKGTPFWYQSAGSGGSVPGAYQNAALTVLIGGTWEHNSVTNGHLILTGGSAIYRLGLANNCVMSAFADIDLTTNRILYVILPSTDVVVTYGFGADAATPVIPKAITALSPTTITVGLGGNYFLAGKLMAFGQEYTYTTFTPGTGVFSGVSPDPTLTAHITDDVYQLDTAGVSAYHISNSSKVPGRTGTTSEGAERVIWLGVYDGSSVIQLKNGDLEQGEQINVGDNTSLNVLTYIGSPNEAANNPSYATLAPGAKTGTESYNSVAGENLTTRVSKLTSMMSDKAQDRTIKAVRSGITNIVNTTSGLNQLVTFTGATPVLKVIMPGSANNGTINLGLTLTLAANQAAYLTMDRNAAFTLADLTALTVVATTAVPINENVLIFAYRLSDNLIYLWDGTRINVGSWPSNQVLVQSIWDRLGLTSESTFEAYTSTYNFAVGDTHPRAISLLDAAVNAIQTDLAKEEKFIVGGGGQTIFNLTTIVASALNTVKDIQVFVNGQKMDQSVTGALNEDYRKNSTTQIEFAYTVPEFAKVVVRDERTGGIASFGSISGSLIPDTDNVYDIGAPLLRFRDGYFAGKLTVVGGVDPEYIQLSPQPGGGAIPNNSLWVDSTDSNKLKHKDNGGSSGDISGGGGGPSSNFFAKIKQNLSGSIIPAGSPVALKPDGSVVLADSDGVGTQTIIGISMVSIPASGGLGSVMLFGASMEGILTSLGFSPGDEVYISETLGAYTNNPASFTGDNDSIIRVGFADCAGGTASGTVVDLIVFPEVLVRP